jgi:hypothetical protein
MSDVRSYLGKNPSRKRLQNLTKIFSYVCKAYYFILSRYIWPGPVPILITIKVPFSIGKTIIYVMIISFFLSMKQNGLVLHTIKLSSSPSRVMDTSLCYRWWPIFLYKSKVTFTYGFFVDGQKRRKMWNL